MSSQEITIKHKIHSKALESIKRAFYNTGEVLKHRQVTNTHLLLGVLATGNNDTTLPIPRILRGAGADYEKLRLFLVGNFELLSPNPGAELKLSTYGKQTLARASKIAKRRATSEAQNSIITSDLVVAILRSREPLLAEALKSMDIDKSALLAKLSDNTSQNRPQHLQAVS